MSRAKSRPVPAAVQAGFDRFWAAYPARRDNPKKPGLKVFADLVEAGADMEALVRAAGAFAAHVKAEGFDAKFTPHARTWLAQERFEEWTTDDLASAPATGPSPEHPLSPLHGRIGDAAWASYIAPLVITVSFPGARIEAPTRFALDRVRQSWGRDIEARLGRVLWAVRA